VKHERKNNTFSHTAKRINRSFKKFEKPGYVLPGGYTSPDGVTMHKKGFDQWWYIVEYNCRTERRECITNSTPISCANLLNMLSTWLSKMLTLD